MSRDFSASTGASDRLHSLRKYDTPANTDGRMWKTLLRSSVYVRKKEIHGILYSRKTIKAITGVIV